MKYYLFSSLLFLLTTTYSSAQNNPNVSQQATADSLKKDAISQAAINNPALRQIHISTDIIGSGDITSKLYGQPLFKGKARTVRTSAILTVPVKSWGNNSITATGSYYAQHIKVNEIEMPDGSFSDHEINYNKFTVGLTATFLRRDILFGKPVFYMASITGLTNEASSIKKLSYLGSAIFLLKQTQSTRVLAGVIINIDPSLNIPAIPLFTYWHKFKNNVELNIGIPTGFGLRKEVTKNMWANLGTSISGSIAFFNLNYPNVPTDVNYTVLDLKNGLGLEYRLAKRFMVGVNGGVLTPMSARAFERNQSSKNYFLDNKLGNSGYINFTFSVLPFL